MTGSQRRPDEDWSRVLSKEEFHICREGGTERAFTGVYWDCHDDGMYRCRCCEAALFSSETKFESGSGWPSFTGPATPESVVTRPDDSHGMHRIEVRCAACDAHLGHVFPDGPGPTGQRYCINSASLTLDKTS